MAPSDALTSVSSVGHGLPALLACTTTFLVLLLIAIMPHGSTQASHGPGGPSWQSRGQDTSHDSDMTTPVTSHSDRDTCNPLSMFKQFNTRCRIPKKG